MQPFMLRIEYPLLKSAPIENVTRRPAHFDWTPHVSETVFYATLAQWARHDQSLYPALSRLLAG